MSTFFCRCRWICIKCDLELVAMISCDLKDFLWDIFCFCAAAVERCLLDLSHTHGMIHRQTKIQGIGLWDINSTVAECKICENVNRKLYCCWSVEILKDSKLHPFFHAHNYLKKKQMESLVNWNQNQVLHS